MNKIKIDFTKVGEHVVQDVIEGKEYDVVATGTEANELYAAHNGLTVEYVVENMDDQTKVDDLLAIIDEVDDVVVVHNDQIL